MKILEGKLDRHGEGAIILNPRKLPELLERLELSNTTITGLLYSDSFIVSTESGVDHHDVEERAGFKGYEGVAMTPSAWINGARALRLTVGAGHVFLDFFNTENDQDPDTIQEAVTSIRQEIESHPRVKSAYGGVPEIQIAARDADYCILWEFDGQKISHDRTGDTVFGLNSGISPPSGR